MSRPPADRDKDPLASPTDPTSQRRDAPGAPSPGAPSPGAGADPDARMDPGAQGVQQERPATPKPAATAPGRAATWAWIIVALVLIGLGVLAWYTVSQTNQIEPQPTPPETEAPQP